MRKSTKAVSLLTLKDTSKMIRKKSTKPSKPQNGKVNKKEVAKSVKNQVKKVKGSGEVIPKLTEDDISNLVSVKIKPKKQRSSETGIVQPVETEAKAIKKQTLFEIVGVEKTIKKSKPVKKGQPSETVSVKTIAKKSKTNKKKLSGEKSTVPLIDKNDASTKKKRLENTQHNDNKDIESKPNAFSEDVFESIVSKDKVRNVVNLLKSKVEDEVSKTKKIFTDFRYLLNVTSFQIPNCPKRIVKLNLKHGLYSTTENDIVFITKDLERGSKVDYEPTIQFYEDLLRSKGVENMKILPFNQIRKEYNTFELKRKLSNLYDYYLCDGSIVGHVTGCLGTTFQKTRCTLHAVKASNQNTIACEIGKSLKRTSFLQLRKGNVISIPIGTHKHSEAEISENIIEVVKQLKTIFPGSFKNIRNMFIKIDITGTSSLPIYISLAKPIVKTPNVIGLRERKINKLKRRANDILSNFKITPNAKFEKLPVASKKMKGDLPTQIEKVTTKNIKGKKVKKINVQKGAHSGED